MATLARSARDERARAEAETRAKVDGRKLRRKGRTEQVGIRITPEARERLERLSQLHGLSFAEVVEKSLVLLEKQTKGR